MEYAIVKSSTHDRLVAEVNKWLSEGWQLYGSPYANQQGQHFQAMLKKS